MFNRIFIVFVAFAALAGATVTAGATERFALVIGNSNYQSVAPLDNPGRDAAAVESLLKSASFDVTDQQ